ncbi:hypothetical protein H2200_002880 [Cladophialophora chaetospira]|uniref:Uncharacterized protein n=1 Tax=Cladophialophora chaetospira TaxID=386627 RepID=A0AA38XH63_9EURO|nr:hypothetical protein H2200_002880 [Cladophialophora chaetospira]
MSEPQQQPTPEKTPRPGAERSNSEMSSTDADDQGYESRSRSQSRRRRRQNQRQKQAQSKAQAGGGQASAQSMASVPEQAEETEEHPSQQLAQRPPEQRDQPQWLQNPDPRDITETQPFDRIKPPGESMMGPVTYARMIRGEIPWRGPPPSQPLETAKPIDSKDSSGKDPMDQDGLKLRIELNLDIEIELKASIHGDLTLALL